MAFLGGNLLSGKKSWAQGLSQDLGQSLQGLAQHKASQMENAQKSKVWQSLGLDHQTASSLAAQPENIQKAFLERLEGAQFGGEQQVPVQNLQQQPQEHPTYTPEQSNILKSTQSPLDRQKIAEQFRLHNQSQAQPITPTEEPTARIGKAAAQQQAIETAAPKPGIRLGATPQERIAARKEAHELEKYELQKYDKEVKESKDYLKTVKKSARATKENNARLDRMEKLAKSGKLDSPGFASGLDTLAHGLWGVGINMKSLQSPETQEFEKLSFDMLKGIQDIFGSRILKTEVDNFLKTIPTLQQSNEGKIAVIENLKLLNEAKLAQEKVTNDIIKQNNGVVPPDLELLVDGKLDNYLDDIHDRFVAQTHTPVKNKNGFLNAVGKVAKWLHE